MALLCVLPIFAHAGLVIGDEVTVTFDPINFPRTGFVGPGAETGLGSFSFDFNAGAGGDVFEWTGANIPGNLNGISGITLTSLEFDDASTLIDFNLFSTVLPNLDFTVTATSIAFTFDAIFEAGPGTILSGQFITPTTTVPEPDIFALMLLGLVGLRLRRLA